MEQIKNKLKQIREDRGFTQVQIAKAVNMSARDYQRYETGRRTPNIYRAMDLAEALGTTVYAIYPKQGASPAIG